MKIKIIDVNYKPEEGVMTLEECGFEVGDVVEVSGKCNIGKLLIHAIRETEFVNVGNEVSISEFEYEVVEE